MKENRLLFTNALIVLPTETIKGSLAVEDGKITGIFESGTELPGFTEVDVHGKALMPGAIDTHVHMWDPSPLNYREDWACGSQCAASGGITTIIDMPLSVPPVVDKEGFQLKLDVAQKESCVDFAFWGGLTPNCVQNMEELNRLGCVAYKGFMSFANPDYPQVTDGYLVQGMRKAATFNGLIGVHAENAEVADFGSKEMSAIHCKDFAMHDDARPWWVEQEAISRAVLFARETGARLYICHMTIAQGAAFLKQAKFEGVNVSVETCPHYLLFDKTILRERGAYAKCNPPFRSRENVEKLWSYILDGTIDTLGSDHGPYRDDEKVQAGDFWKEYSGFGGFDAMLAAMLTEGYHRRGLSLSRLSCLTATNAANIMQLAPRKGSLLPGRDADILVVDLDREWVFDGTKSLSKTKTVHNLYHGMKMKGKVEQTYVRGQLVYNDGEITAQNGFGQYIPRQASRRKYLMEHDDLIVSMKGIQKSFGGVHALTDGELTLRKGEVLGLIGENGAGKSTLMKILSGVYQADAGVMLVDGKEVHYHEPRQALHDGICMIYQELNLVQHLSVGDNIFIGRESQKGWKLDRTKDNRRAEELLKELELDVSPNTTVSSLTVAKQQMIEIAKGISYDSKVLIMDEPTAALSINEIKDLFRVIQKLKAKGISIIYISHRLEELFEITDRITVMRDGAFINTFITKESSLPELIRSMVGREVSWEKKKHSNVAADAPVLLEVQGMESHAIKNASFKLRKGEILGIGGLMGAGRTELARLVFGADWRKHGKILKNGEEIQIRTPHDAVKNGIGYISEDRKALGLALKLSVADNIAMPNWEKFTSHGVVNEKEEMRVAAEMADRVMVKTPSVKQLVMNLSGGNQQKVAIAKWLLRDCDILIFDEPTRGIDIGAKSEIYNLINELIAQGKSIIMISSEMQELLSMSDRIIVMCEGSITGELDIADATQESIMALAVRRAV